MSKHSNNRHLEILVSLVFIQNHGHVFFLYVCNDWGPFTSVVLKFIITTGSICNLKVGLLCVTSDCMLSTALYCLSHLLSSFHVQKPCPAGCKEGVIIPAFKLFGFCVMREESREELCLGYLLESLLCDESWISLYSRKILKA